LTFYFPLYLTSLTERNLSLGLSASGAMVLAGLAVPWLGALSDRTGKTKRYLILTTLLYASFVFCLSLFREVPMLIAAFLLSCFFYHAALVFYCALLPVVAEPKRQGSASGLGTALGYLGVLFAVPIAHLVDSFFERRFVFAVAGLLVLIFSIPLILWVPERRVTNPLPVEAGSFRAMVCPCARTPGCV
jgi:UMF1 family MFS transporter